MRGALRVAGLLLGLGAASAGCGADDGAGEGGDDGSGSGASAATGGPGDDGAAPTGATSAGTGDEASATNATHADSASDDDTGSGPSTGGSDDGDTDGTDGTGDTGRIGGEPNVLYVRNDGEDSNPGTVDAPMRTIQWAIAQAEGSGEIDTIRVAEGSYAIDYANSNHIVMIDGISLYGGYRADWGDHDPAQYVTSIVDESPTPIASSSTDPHRAVEIPAGVGEDTVLDGFHVGVALGQYRAALFVEGDATIHNNTIAPTLDDDVVTAYALRILDGSPTVLANHVALDVAQPASYVRAIFATGCDGVFANNVIDLSGASYDVHAFSLEYGSPHVLGNSVYVPDVTNATIVWLTGSTPTLENNLFESEDLTATCIWSQGLASVPMAAHDNVLDCYYTLFGTDPLRSWTTIMQLEDGLANTADNLKLPATIVDPSNDMMLDAQDPCTVSRGGLDVSAELPDDVAALARTVPLSIGAHEWDGDCQ